MNFERRSILILIVILLVTTGAVAQAVPTRTPRTNDPNRQDAQTRRWYEELQRRENTPTGIGSIRETNETLIAGMQKKAKEKLEPAADDKKAFEGFLSAPKTGLITLAYETNCSKILDISKPDNECLLHYLPGMARAFSFRKENYTHRAYADLERYNGNFTAPGTFILGFMTYIDAPIESVTIQSQAVINLSNFEPAVGLDEIIKQEKELNAGMTLGDLTYRRRLPIKENTTYLLRSVGYHAKFNNLPKSDRRKGNLEDDDRSDVIVVFRVVRLNPDGSLLLLWKELFRKDAPKLEVDFAMR